VVLGDYYNETISEVGNRTPCIVLRRSSGGDLYRIVFYTETFNEMCETWALAERVRIRQEYLTYDD
jgi:hypothetical protein